MRKDNGAWRGEELGVMMKEWERRVQYLTVSVSGCVG